MLERYKDWVRRNAGLLSLFETGKAPSRHLQARSAAPPPARAVEATAAAHRHHSAAAARSLPAQACPASPGCCPTALRRVS